MRKFLYPILFMMISFCCFEILSAEESQQPINDNTNSTVSGTDNSTQGKVFQPPAESSTNYILLPDSFPNSYYWNLLLEERQKQDTPRMLQPNFDPCERLILLPGCDEAKAIVKSDHPTEGFQQ